jgi:hypothetical protein
MNEEIQAQADMEARANAGLGAVLNAKYRLDRVLGFGAMATVYAATHRNGKEVALKLLHPELAGNADVRTRFLREGYVANQVRHSGAVAVLDDDVTEEGWAFLVMELLDGVTVEEFWQARGSQVDPACVCALTLQLLDVMEAAHERGIVHRDLKPPNLFLLPSGELKVLDFGIACLRTAARTSNVGAVMGTPQFMAPEQALGRVTEIDARTDLWAIGAVAFALLVGEVVHPAASPEETLIYAATQPARSLASLAPGTPASIARVLDRALAFDRSRRWGSAGEMRDALTRAAIDAYGEVPGAPALRAALMRRMMGGHARARETMEHARQETHAPWMPTVPSKRATLLGHATPFDSWVTTIGEASTASVVAAPTLRTHRSARRVAPAAGMAVVAAATLALVLSHVLSPVAAQASAPMSPPPAVALVTDWTPIAAPPILPAVFHPLDTSENAASHPPAVAAPPPKTHAARKPRAIPAPRQVASSPPAHCSPPFTIDPASHIKMWKMECL